MDYGWIKLNRKLLNNPLYRNSKYVHLWVHLLLKANHKGDKIMWNGGILDIKEGEFVTGRKSLSSETGIPESTCEDILKYLEKEGQIRQQTNSKFRVITILNWKNFQDVRQQSNNKATTKRQPADTNKNDKKVKNEKNIVAGDTPADQARDFFSKGNLYDAIRTALVEKNPPTHVDAELHKFLLYWTEPNKTGTKARWEQQPTFDVKRRLYTWLSKVREVGGGNRRAGREIISSV